MHTETAHGNADRWIFYGFLLLLAWTPLPLGSNRPWAWSLMEIWVFMLAIFWLIAWLRNRVSITPVFHSARPVLLLFLCWLLWVGFQLVSLPPALLQFLSPQAHELYTTHPDVTRDWLPLSVNVYATGQGFLKSVSYVLVFCLALLLLNSRKRVEQCTWIIILSGVFQAVYGSLMTLTGVEYTFFVEKTQSMLGYASGTFVNRNHLAGYLEMCLATGIGFMIANLEDKTHYDSWRDRLRSWLQLLFSAKARVRLFLVIMVIALVLTHSRMGNVAFFISLMIAGCIGLALSKHATRSMVILLISLLVIDIFLVGTWFGIEKVAERLEETSLVTEDRDDAYHMMLDQLNEYRWTGSGLGTFYQVFPKYRTRGLSAFYNHAHNDYLEFATETGIIGFVIISATVVWSLVVALLAQYRRHDPLMRGISFAAIMGIVSLLIHATVDFNLQIPANALLFVLLMAMAWIALHLETRHRHQYRHRA